MFAHHDTDRTDDKRIGESTPVLVPRFLRVHSPSVGLHGGYTKEETKDNQDKQEERRKLQR